MWPTNSGKVSARKISTRHLPSGGRIVSHASRSLQLEDVTIVGNVVHCEGGTRRAVWLPEECHNLRMVANTLSGGDVWVGDAQVEPPLLLSFEAAEQGG